MHKILREDLHMRKISANRVPNALSEQQKWCRYETCRIHLERYQNGENLLEGFVDALCSCLEIKETKKKKTEIL